MRKIERISLTATDRERLERLVRDRNTPQKVVWRARIVLLDGQGLAAEEIAAAVGKSLLTALGIALNWNWITATGLLRIVTALACTLIMYRGMSYWPRKADEARES